MEDIIELQHIIVEIEAGNISIADAAANNLDLLNFIADEESYPGQATAQLILSQAGIREFEEVIKLPEPIIENKSIDIQKGNTDNFSTNDDIINVYPNPTAGNIYVEYAFLNNSDNGFIEIYGITGNLVYRTELSQPIGVFTYKEKLPAGNYIIKVGNDFSQKITIQ